MWQSCGHGLLYRRVDLNDGMYSLWLVFPINAHQNANQKLTGREGEVEMKRETSKSEVKWLSFKHLGSGKPTIYSWRTHVGNEFLTACIVFGWENLPGCSPPLPLHLRVYLGRHVLFWLGKPPWLLPSPPPPSTGLPRKTCIVLAGETSLVAPLPSIYRFT